jgi:hypothetical protein
MKNKKILLSAFASTLLINGNLSAQTIEMKSGWNLVGIQAKSTENTTGSWSISNLTTQYSQLEVLTNVTRTYTVGKTRNSLSELEPSKGYWIKASSDFNLSLDGEDIASSDIELNAGWNLTVFNDEIKDTKAISSFIDKKAKDGLKLDIITNVTRTYTVGKTRNSLSELDPNSGYWVKVQKLADTVTTTDGYDVELYIDNENSDISAVKTALANKKASEIDNLTFDNVSNVVLSTTVDGVKHSSTYLDPRSDFGTTLTSVLTNTLDANLIRSNQATSGSSIYVYAVSEGGSPSIIANVSVYELNSDGSTGELLGTTSNSGFLYLNEIPSSGKVIVMKDHYFPSIQEISSTEGSANYIFINEDSGIVTVEDGEVSSSNGRVLNSIFSDRDLDLSKPKLHMSKGGTISIPAGSKALGTIAINSSAIQSYPDYKELSSSVLTQTGYKVEEIGNMLVLSMAGKSYAYNNLFSDLVSFTDAAGAGTLSDIQVSMGINLSDELKEKLFDENDQITQTTISDFKNGLELYIYKDGSWKKETNFELKIREASTFSSDEEKYLKKYLSNGLIVLNGDFYNGAYPMIAVYKDAVNVTPDLKPNELTLNVCVVDAETNDKLKDALVKIEMGNSNIEHLADVNDTTGYASFTILSAKGAVEDFSLSVIDGNHYPISKVLNVNSLVQPVGENNNSAITNLCEPFGEPIRMIAPPKQATVKGSVYNVDNQYSVENAKVKLVAPIALSDVRKDVVKTINSRDVKGIEVGSIQNANYKWFIKKHTDEVAIDNTTTNSRTLQRVSEKRWLLIQEGTAKNDGNFLSYNKVLNMALQSPKDTDPEDVKIIASGQFDIAIQVEHDIDNDGKADFYELAKSNSIEQNLIGEEFYELPDSEYSHLGYISTLIDIEKLYADLGDQVTTEVGFAVKTERVNSNDWFMVDGSSAGDLYGDFTNSGTDFNSTFASLGLIDEESFFDDSSLNNNDAQLNYIAYASQSFKILGNTDRGYIRVKEENTDTAKYTYNSTTWDLVVDAYVAVTGGGTYVALQQQTDGSFKWVKSDGGVDLEADEVANGILLQKSDNKKLMLNKVAQKISSNAFLEKLAMPISKILEEANVSETPLSPNSILFDDGFTMTMVPTIQMTTVADNKEVLVRMKTEMDLSDVELKKYVVLSDVFVDKPTLTPSTQYDTTDRVGLYQFSAVDMDFKQLGQTENSLVRVSASKMGYFDSPSINVPKFAIDDPSSDPREDVKVLNIGIKDRPTFSVDFNITDENGEPINDAIISIDGIKTVQDLTEFESVSTLKGATGTFENVLGGKGTTRVVRVSVPDSDFISRIVTLRNFDKDSYVPVTLINSTDIPDSMANISISEIGVDYSQGIARVSTNIFDSEDNSGARTLTSSSEIYTYVNGTLVNGKISRESDISEAITLYLPLEIGTNEIVIEVANRVGISRSSSVRVDYNPKVGTVVGKIIDLDNNSDYTTLVDIFNENGIYINTIVATTKTDADSNFIGEYILENAEAGKIFNLMATQYDSNGDIKKYSTEMTKIKIPVATTIRVDLNNMDSFSETNSPVIGAPTFDLIRDIKPSDVNSSNGLLNFSATISNFDKENGAIYFVVNDATIEINTSALNGGDYSYNLQNYKVQLDEGKNVVYGMAFNPNMAYVWTKDFVIDYIPDGATLNTLTLTLNGCEIDNGCSVLPYSYVTIYKESNATGLAYLGSGETDYNGQIEFMNLASGDYYLVPDIGSDFVSDFVSKAPYKISLPANNSYEINVSEYTDSITFEPFSIYGIDVNDTKVTVNLGDANISQFTFDWKAEYYDVNGTYTEAFLGSTQTVSTPDDIYGYITLKVDVTQSGSNETLSDYVEIYTEEPEETNTTLPRPPSTPTF